MPSTIASSVNASGRIVFLVSHSSSGGAQEIWANIAEAFRVRGHDVSLMALYPYREPIRETSPELPWVYVTPTRPKSPLDQLRMFRSLVRFIREEKPAVILTALPAANVMAALASSIAGVGTKVVTSHHSPAQTYNPILDRIDGVLGGLKSVKAVVSVSDAVKSSQDDKPAAYRAKRVTIRNALPPKVEQQLAELSVQRDRSVARGRRLVATGRLAPQKNYPVLIRAARHMRDVDIEIVGEGPDEAELKAMAIALGVEGRVRFAGFLPREETLNRLADADVFTQPSLFEGHSLALVEAAKLGIPLVVSNVPVQMEGITTADGQACGVAVDPHDDRALADAVLKLLDEPSAYRDYAARSAALAREATFDAMILAYEAVIR